MGTPNTEGIRQLVDQEIDVTIGMLPDFSAIFNSPVIGLDALGVQRETDFYLGMAWTSITDGFNSAIVDTYKRPMTIYESKILVERILARLPELKKAISDLGM
jgi:hypothetical protein